MKDNRIPQGPEAEPFGEIRMFPAENHPHRLALVTITICQVASHPNDCFKPASHGSWEANSEAHPKAGQLTGFEKAKFRRTEIKKKKRERKQPT